MRISGITLQNFRNYKAEQINLADGLNVLFGKNASGKTNMVEGIYYSGLGKSYRTTKDKELILWGEEWARITINLEKKYRKHIIEIHIDSAGKKRIAIDKIPVTRISELIGVLNIVFFSPDEMAIINDSPQERRRFLDISLSQQRKIYYHNLVNYNKVLAQRNKTLKAGYKDSVGELLPIWDAQLASLGVNIIKARYEFVEKLKDFAKESQLFLTNNQEELKTVYESKIPYGDTQEMTKSYLKQLKAGYEKDIALQYTGFGAHRDDLEILINDMDVRKFGSQGQRRTTALALKLAEVKMFIEEVGEKPILILDDVLSELDKDRQKMLLECAKGMQTILTCTDFEGECDKKIMISSGKAIEK